MNGNDGNHADVRIACSSLLGAPEQFIVVAHAVGLVLVFPPTATAADQVAGTRDVR